MTALDVDKLRAAAATAAQKAADAAARVDAAAAAESADRERRAREWDTQLVDSFDEAVARERVAVALRRVHEAVATTGADPFAAWLEYQVEHRRFWHAAMEARAAAGRLGRTVGTSLLPSVHEDFNAMLKTAVAREAARRHADELEQLNAERERFVSGSR